jgi:hypothetical protein
VGRVSLVRVVCLVLVWVGLVACLVGWVGIFRVFGSWLDGWWVREWVCGVRLNITIVFVLSLVPVFFFLSISLFFFEPRSFSRSGLDGAEGIERNYLTQSDIPGLDWIGSDLAGLDWTCSFCLLSAFLSPSLTSLYSPSTRVPKRVLLTSLLPSWKSAAALSNLVVWDV